MTARAWLRGLLLGEQLVAREEEVEDLVLELLELCRGGAAVRGLFDDLPKARRLRACKPLDELVLRLRLRRADLERAIELDQPLLGETRENGALGRSGHGATPGAYGCPARARRTEDGREDRLARMREVIRETARRAWRSGMGGAVADAPGRSRRCARARRGHGPKWPRPS
jgi:hypothetical protein